MNVPPVAQSHPARADIALFVGFVSRRRLNGTFTAIPQPVQDFLVQNGWRSAKPPTDPGADELRNVPVPIVSWDVFDLLFAWDLRSPVDQMAGVFWTYLGAAIRSFFQQGGRKCYVVSVSDPVLAGDQSNPPGTMAARLGVADGQFSMIDPADRTTWSGIAHVLGLPDVSMLCLPDLPECVADQALGAPTMEETQISSPEVFTECSSNDMAQPLHSTTLIDDVPRGGGDQYSTWLGAVANVTTWLSSDMVGREVQLIAALPYPPDGSLAEHDPLQFLTDPLSRKPASSQGLVRRGIASAFVQVVYPWVSSAASQNLPGGLEPPDGVLAGLIARNALTRGTFRSAAGQPLAEIVDLSPELSADQTDRAQGLNGIRLIDRLSVLGDTPAGIQLISDVSTSLDLAYRPAGIHRLVAVILRAVRLAGQSLIFEPSGENTWNRVEQMLNGLFNNLLSAGALNTDVSSPYSVRCDRTTMTQNDLDSGRLIATVSFAPAYPIERITVVLAMSEGGVVSLSSASSSLLANAQLQGVA